MMTWRAWTTRGPAGLMLGLAVAGSLAFAACSSSQSATPSGDGSGDDGGDVDPDTGPYEGPTTGGAVHSSAEDAGTDPLADARFVEDKTCCNVVFAIAANGEPAGSTAVVVGSVAPLLPPGVALASSGGVWSAPACVPINVPLTYAYEFTEPVAADSLDAGSDDDAGADASDAALGSEDAGTIVVQRYDPNRPHQADGLGGVVNVYDAVTSCAAIDASTGTLP